MAAHRIAPSAIQLPFQRAAQQIEQLQLKDSHLHATILALKNKIHSTRTASCKDCGLYEQQIAVIRTQEKEKAQQLEQAVQRLQQENIVLAKQNQQLYASQQLEAEQHRANKESQHRGRDIEIADRADRPMVEEMLDQHMRLNDIDDMTVTIQMREKRQQEILSKMKKRRNCSARDNQPKTNFVEANSHRKTNSEIPQIAQEHLELDPEISLQLKQLRQKSAYFEQLCKNYQECLNEKNEMKEQDSLRIISQLQEIQNFRKELQNMDKHYQLQCQQLQQQKQNKQYELGLLVQQQQTEISTINKRIEAVSADNSNLTQQLQNKHSQVLALSKNVADKDIEIARATSSLETLKKDYQQKHSQLQRLASQLSSAESHIYQLSLTVEQQKILNRALQEKNTALLQQVEQLKHQFFALQAQATSQKGGQAGQIDYLKNIIQQNGTILQSKIQQINHLQQELARQQNTQKRLRESLEEVSSSAEKNEMLLIQHKQKVANLQNQRILISCSLQSLQAQRAQISQHLQKQVQEKSTLSHKYLQQAGKNVQLGQRINALQQQLLEYKSNTMEALTVKEARDMELKSLKQQLQQVDEFNKQMQNDSHSLKKHSASLEQQLMHLKAQKQSLLAEKISLQDSNTQIILQNSRIIEQSTTEKQNLLNSIVKLQEDINIKSELLSQKQAEVEQKDLQAQSRSQRISNLQVELSKEREQSANLHAKSLQLQDQIDKLNESLSQSKTSSINKETSNSIFNLEKQIGNKEYQLQERQNQLKQTQTQYSSLLRKHEVLLATERKHIDNIAYLSEKIDSLNKVYQASAGQSTEELVKELNKKKQTITELLTNFKYIEKALSKKESDFDQLSQKYQKLTKTSQKRHFQLDSRLAAKESEASMLKREKQQEGKRSNAIIKDLEKELARLAEQRKKSEQNSSREISSLKESLEFQKKKSQQSSQNTSPVKLDHSRKDLQILKKEIAEKNSKIIQLQKQLSDKDTQLSTLKQINTDNQIHIKQMADMLTEAEVHHDVKEHQLQKSKQITTQLQQQIVNLKAELVRSQAKCHQLQNEDTEKNLANDFLWVQLQQQKNKVKKLQNKNKEIGSLKMMKQQSLEIRITSAVELPANMGIINQEKEKEEKIQLPLSIKQETKDQQAIAHQPEEQVPLTHKKSSSKNLLFQNTLSDVLSDSQQNDEINQMVEKDSDSKSHLQSSIEAFSEYSRIKSTKSQLTHKEVEQHYKSKMKSTLLLAKLAKKPKKK